MLLPLIYFYTNNTYKYNDIYGKKSTYFICSFTDMSQCPNMYLGDGVCGSFVMRGNIS